MKLTPFAKVFITLVVLAVVGYVVYAKFGSNVRTWATGSSPDAPKPNKPEAIDKTDFTNLANAPKDPDKKAGVSGVNAATVKQGKLNRPLVVAINTWAGHAPGIVFNRGLDVNEKSRYKSEFGLDVKFILLEDPAAKLAAFKKGDVDIMWDTVDNWAREASELMDSQTRGKSIIQQDWSRGGDGIVSLASIKSVEDLKGKKIACTQFTPSHFLLLFLLSQSGLSPEDRSTIEKNIVFTQDAPAAAACSTPSG